MSNPWIRKLYEKFDAGGGGDVDELFAVMAQERRQNSLFLARMDGDGQEIKIDPSLVDAHTYHGRAAEGADTATAVWEVVRIEKDSSGNTLGWRYRENVAWDDRADGW